MRKVPGVEGIVRDSRNLKEPAQHRQQRRERQRHQVRGHIVRVPKRPGLYFDSQKSWPGGQGWHGAWQKAAPSRLGRFEEGHHLLSQIPSNPSSVPSKCSLRLVSLPLLEHKARVRLTELMRSTYGNGGWQAEPLAESGGFRALSQGHFGNSRPWGISLQGRGASQEPHSTQGPSLKRGGYPDSIRVNCSPKQLLPQTETSTITRGSHRGCFQSCPLWTPAQPGLQKAPRSHFCSRRIQCLSSLHHPGRASQPGLYWWVVLRGTALGRRCCGVLELSRTAPTCRTPLLLPVSTV